ncbi:MAG: hypothetical protein K6G19_05825 [Lachnospiraceae bacterium]|nr:hypothetical protein [Lachnospiraceae bacterium]
MSAEEEYLDQLLAQALNPKKENKEPEKKTADAGSENPVAAADTLLTEETAAAGDVMGPAEVSDDFSGDFDVPHTADLPELDLNSRGAKDFNLDGISADELASEIEAFEEDADDSVLPTVEGSGDTSDTTDTAPDGADAVLEGVGALDGDDQTDIPDVPETGIPDESDGASDDIGAVTDTDMPDGISDDIISETADETLADESLVDEENTDAYSDDEKSDNELSKALDELPEDIPEEVSEENQEDISDAYPEAGSAENDGAEAEAVDDISAVADINAVDDLLSGVGEAGGIDDEAISDFSEEVDAEGEADDLMSLLKGDGAGDDIQSDLSELADMDPDDIEARIAAAEADVPGESLPSTDGDADILDMLSDMDVLDGDLGDIKEVLEKSDNNEALNADLLKEPDVGPGSFYDDSDEEESEGGKKSQKKKKEKKKKEKGSFFAKLFGKNKKDKDTGAEAENEGEVSAETADSAASSDMELLDDVSDIPGEASEDSVAAADNGDDAGDSKNNKKKKKEKGEKKKGLIAALLEAVFYEEDEGGSPEENATKLSDENKQILNELDAEGEEKGKKKKKKKEKKPKEKKPKKPREKKPKKEKPAGEEENGPKIPKKYIIRTSAFAISVLAAAIVLAVFLPKANVMKSARTAYYDHDYKEAFYSMYGKKLNESDQLIYDRSKTIILMDRKLESYGQYKAMGLSDKALDALFQGLKRYEALKSDAETLGVIGNIDSTRDSILLALQNDYGVSEEQAMEIIGYSKTDYTGAVNAILRGEPYVKMQDAVNAMYGLGEGETAAPETAEESDPSEAGLPDMLPEEEQYVLENGTDPNGSEETTVPENSTAEEPARENDTESNTQENDRVEENAAEQNSPEQNSPEQNSTNIIVDTEDNVQVQIDSTQF